MDRRKKYFLTSLFFMLVLMLLILPSTVLGADLVEVEPNNEFVEATSLPIGRFITGNLETDKDWDYYRVDIEDDGYATIQFNHDLESNDYRDHFRVQLMVPNKDGSTSTFVFKDIPGDSRKNTLLPSGIGPGVYYIRVIPRTVYSNASYQVKIDFTKSSVWEKEKNDITDNATQIMLNTTYNGNSFYSADRDYFKFTITEKSDITLKFSHTIKSTKDRDFYKIEVFSDKLARNKIFETTVKQNEVNGSYRFEGLGRGTYYISIIPTGAEFIEANYQITVSDKLNGWIKEAGKYYYYDNGKVLKNWNKIDGKWYYMDSKGVMQTGWHKIGGKWYYMASSGAMQTGWTKVGSKWYYLGSSGAMQTGWIKLGSKWYYMDSSGAMRTGWTKVGSRWYYMDSSGAMQTGWVRVGSKWYYMSSSGVMQTNRWISGKYYVGSDGAMYVNRRTPDGYFVGKDGIWIRGR